MLLDILSHLLGTLLILDHTKEATDDFPRIIIQSLDTIRSLGTLLLPCQHLLSNSRPTTLYVVRKEVCAVFR